MKVLNEDLERTRWNRAHSHFFESAVSLTGGEAELPRVPEVLRFEAACADSGN